MNVPIRFCVVAALGALVYATRVGGADQLRGTAGESSGGTSGTVSYARLQWNDGLFLLDGRPFTGIAEQRDREGRLRARYSMVDGKLHGIVEEWYTNGVKSAETTFENNQRHGTNRYWDATGRLLKIQVWRHDELISEVAPTSSPPVRAAS